MFWFLGKTYRHLTTFTVVFDVNVLVIRTPASGISRVTEAPSLVDFTVAAKGFVIIGANFAPGIDFRITLLYAEAFGCSFLRDLKKRKIQNK